MVSSEQRGTIPPTNVEVVLSNVARDAVKVRGPSAAIDEDLARHLRSLPNFFPACQDLQLTRASGQ